MARTPKNKVVEDEAARMDDEGASYSPQYETAGREPGAFTEIPETQPETSEASVQVRINPVFWREDKFKAGGVEVTHEPTKVTEAHYEELSKYARTFPDNDGSTVTRQVVVKA